MDYGFLIENNYQLIEIYSFNDKYVSYVFSYGEEIIIIDDSFDIANNQQECFDYGKYCEMQNKYMFSKKRIFRFNFTGDKISFLENINKMMYDEDSSFEDNGGHFSENHLDNTAIEKSFEDIFSDIYGNESLMCLKKEVGISSPYNTTFFIDYVLETKEGNFAFEENGVHYHHPCYIGKEKYEKQLIKQNYIVKLGYKIYRFSTENLLFANKVKDELLSYLPNKELFIPKSIFTNKRGLSLHLHQTDILNELDRERLQGKKTSLIVIPTATGKSEICLSDLEKEYMLREVKRILILVPSTRIKLDWENRISPIKNNFEVIDINCYISAYNSKNFHDKDYYDYIIFDEAHHAQASTCKTLIQYYTPKYLIGLTATPERLDNKKIQEIFGNYEEKMSIKEGVEKGVLPNIRVYRIISNIDLSNVRYNGKDYNVSDLENKLFVQSRNELIANVVGEFFLPKENFYKQGIVFCVNKDHAKRIALELNKAGIKAEAVYGNNSKNDKIFEMYKNKEIQFLCSCQLISEGWDSPQTEVVVMARPTLSKVLYLQQLGRGLRRYPGKEALTVIDVVDNYSFQLRPCSFNSIFHISSYFPFMGLINNSPETLEILGLSEYATSIQEIDFLSFEDKYKDYLSLENAARELYIGTSTLKEWNSKMKYASVYLPIGRTMVPIFSKDEIERIRQERNLSIHNDDTILNDFIDFIEENTLTFSFKLVFLINSFKCADQEGNIDLTLLTNKYAEFYKSRILNGFPVDKKNCVYNLVNLEDEAFVKRSILENPFEKFERKRFFYLCKDLNVIAFNPILWKQMNESLINDIIDKEMNFLKEYYSKYGGYDDEYQF